MRVARPGSWTIVGCFLLAGSGRASDRQVPPTSPLRAEVEQIASFLHQQRFSDAGREIDRLVQERPTSRNGSRLLEEVYPRLAQDASLAASLEAWCTSPGRSHAPFVIRGLRRVDAAWNARGGGWADGVERTSWPEFEVQLRLAREDLEEAAKRKPGDPNAAAKLIVVAMGQGSARAEMERWFKAAVEADLVAFQPYRAKLDYLQPKWHGTAEEAERFAAECERTAPRGSRVYTVRLELLVEQAARSGDKKLFWARPESKLALDRVMSRWTTDFPSSTEARATLARIRVNEGDSVSAMRLYSEALDIDPGLAELLVLRGDLRRKQKDAAGAEADYRSCLQLQPANVEGLHGLAMIEAYEKHDDDAARALLRRAAEDPAVEADTLVELGRVCARQGDVPEALAAYDRAIRRNGRFGAAYLRRAMTLWPTDRVAAKRDIEKASALGDADLRQRASRFSEFMSGSEAACEAGSAQACLALARRYEDGNQVPRDKGRAGELRARACGTRSLEDCAVPAPPGSPP